MTREITAPAQLGSEWVLFGLLMLDLSNLYNFQHFF